MAAFNAEEYKQKLKTAASIDDCEKVRIPKLKEDQSFIFISYSHKDYKLVYQDLADLRESGIPFWYDEGLPAGRNWDDVVREKLNDRRCRGVIFYLSESLFLSRSIQTEIRIVCGENTRNELNFNRLDYFSVNLTDMLPSAILRKTMSAKEFPDAEDAMDAVGDWTDALRAAFPNKATYLRFSAKSHKMSLIEQIGVRFNITSIRNPYEFHSAEFLLGSATIRFENGSQYNGSFRDNRFSGQGTMEYSSGAVYCGGWENGKHSQSGRMTYPDGTVYDGEWKEGNADGVGAMIFRNGSEYRGEWKAGKRHGTGIMRSPDGAAYEGAWKNGERHGNGVMTYPDGVIYSGEWKNGERHGDGIMTYPDGAILKGNWRNGEFLSSRHISQPGNTYESDKEKSALDLHDVPTGNIEYKWEETDDAEWHSEGTKHYLPDTEHFDSDWEKTEAFSEGCKFYYSDEDYGGLEKGESQRGDLSASPSDDIYEGSRKNGEPHGNGTMRYANGNIYKGEWKNGERHGMGTMTFAGGNVYSGQWKNGERHGNGTVTYPNGNKFVSEWKNDIACGKGTYYYPDGASRSGIWDGITLLEGSGVLRYDDGSWYDGEIRNNLRHGKGVYTLPDGTVQAGIFENDIFMGFDN